MSHRDEHLKFGTTAIIGSRWSRSVVVVPPVMVSVPIPMGVPMVVLVVVFHPLDAGSVGSDKLRSNWWATGAANVAAEEPRATEAAVIVPSISWRMSKLLRLRGSSLPNDINIDPWSVERRVSYW